METKKLMDNISVKNKIHAWLQLIRLPNLFTLPGDAAFGVLAAGGLFFSFTYLKTLIILLGLYLFGLISNDLVDFQEDKKERPDRPLASGKISRSTAKTAAIFILAVVAILSYGFGQQFIITEIFLLIMILAYNFHMKKNFILGPICISICRVLGVILGFYAVTHHYNTRVLMLYLGVWIWFMYFLSLSLAAYYETDSERAIRGAILSFIIPVIWILSAPVISGAMIPVVVMKELNPLVIIGLICTGIFAVHVVKNVLILNYFIKKPADISKAIGELIWNIIFLQASGIAFLGDLYTAIVIISLAIPAKLISKKFYAS